jgi:hypothetical protein
MPPLALRVAVPFARCGVRDRRPFRYSVTYRTDCSLGRGNPNEVRRQFKSHARVFDVQLCRSLVVFLPSYGPHSRNF